MKLKKTLLASITPILLLTFTSGIALARTVHYKGTAVYWDYGNIGKIWAYSKVQSGHYSHRTSVNGVNSGWKKKGVLATAKTWTSPTKKVEAYWDCK